MQFTIGELTFNIRKGSFRVVGRAGSTEIDINFHQESDGKVETTRLHLKIDDLVIDVQV